VIGSLLGRLGADTRLLQQVVRHMPTNDFKLRNLFFKVKGHTHDPPQFQTGGRQNKVPHNFKLRETRGNMPPNIKVK
jgi:hypothetical protein